MLVSLSPKVKKYLDELEEIRQDAEEMRQMYEKKLAKLNELGIDFRVKDDGIDLDLREPDPR